MLRRVRSATELEGLLNDAARRAVAQNPYAAGTDDLPTVLDPASYSGTYTAEAGVDEFDYARYDGSYLYVTTNPSGAPQPGAIRILRTDAGGTATEVSSIPLPADETALGIYVANDRLLLLSSAFNYGSYGGAWLMVMPWAPTHMNIQVFDVSDRAHPTSMLSAEIDGAFVASRRIDDRVILVSRHTPAIVLDPASLTSAPPATLDALLPQITVDGRKSALVTARNCYVTNDGAPAGYPVITTITSLSLRDPADRASVCYNEAADGVYTSPTALYVSEPRDTGSSPQSTRIHKFTLTGPRPEYSGSVEVPGFVWSGGQRDFRINEYHGLVRVMTTQYTQDASDSIEHHLFVLRQKASGHALEIVARLPNAARPEEIGKPNELLYGVRFAGDRAYAATFRRVDPLYVFDLSDRDDPRIAGQLEIPGYSDFMHPVSADLLLGLGQVDNHTKVELFDVSSLEHPQSRGAVVLGGVWSNSEAVDDRHAFAWLPGAQTDRFAIPATLYTSTGNTLSAQTSLYQFEIAGKQVPSAALLSQAGVVTPPAGEPYAYSNRSFIDGNTVWYVRAGSVWSNSWLTPDQVRGPF